MPPKATTSSAPRRPMTGSKPAAASGSTARTATGRPRPGTGAAAGPSRPRVPGRAGAFGPGGSGKPQVDEKPQVNVGEEEWSKLMSESYGQKQSAEWYAKGAKSVEVSLDSLWSWRRNGQIIWLIQYRTSGNYCLLSSKSKASSSSTLTRSTSLLRKISKLS